MSQFAHLSTADVHLLIALTGVEDEIWHASHKAAHLLQLLIHLRKHDSMSTSCCHMWVATRDII